LRRYGGYIVHFGVAFALVGIAASTTFQHQRKALLSPGQSVRSDGYTFKYVRPIATATSQDLGFGAILRVSRGGHYVTTLRTIEGVYPSATSPEPVGRFFDTNLGASVEARVGLDAGLTRDIWAVVSPDLTPLNGLINHGDTLFNRELNKISTLPAREQATQLTTTYEFRDQLVSELTDRWVSHPWPTQFLIEVSPLVSWLWLGGIVAGIGGLIAIWPVPRRPRRDRSTGGRGKGRGAQSGTRGESPSLSAPRERELVARMESTWPAT
jgi:cytochrome c-type biogenesis protein CcmF